MKVLHLLASWKWTGPAEPALEGAALLSREPGLQVQAGLSSLQGRDQENQVEKEARRLGLETLEGLKLPRHLNLAHLPGDVRRLAGILREGGFDLVHCHTLVDHFTAALARLAAGVRVPLVRTWYDPEGPALSFREAWLLRSGLEGAILPRPGAARELARRTKGRVKTEVLLPPVDLEGFDPSLPDMRKEYCCEEEDFVLGVVARMQAHRRWDLLLAAFRRALWKAPFLKLIVLGRGPDWERLVFSPAREIGVEERLVLAGYRRGTEYASTLRTFDALVFLVPGSDGTCRAARQAQAAGAPLIASRRGILPDLVEPGVDGLLVEEKEEELARAMAELALDRDKARAMGEAARRRAEKEYSGEVFLRKTLALYGEVLEGGGSCAG